MVRSREHGCKHLQYTFRHNESDNTIEVGYLFSSGVMEDGGTIVAFKPHVMMLRYSRKQAGPNSEIDKIFDNPQKMAEITKQAEQRFSEILGPSIEKAIQLSVHQALFQSGIKLKGTPTEMATALAQADKRHIAKELGVKRGAPKGVKHKQRHSFTKKTFQVALPRKIRELSRHEEATLTRQAVAHALGLPNAKKLDRLRKQFDDRPWPEVVNEAMGMK